MSKICKKRVHGNDKKNLPCEFKKCPWSLHFKLLKRTWKIIKSLISQKPKVSGVPTVLSLDNGDTITNSYNIAKSFDNYFASIA